MTHVRLTNAERTEAAFALYRELLDRCTGDQALTVWQLGSIGYWPVHFTEGGTLHMVDSKGRQRSVGESGAHGQDSPCRMCSAVQVPR